MIPNVLVVAGLDPSGGAGLLADAEAIRAAGGRPLCCASALTIQPTRAVRGFHAVEAAVVAAQVEALAEEEGPIGAVKLGMLGSAAVVEVLAKLRDHPALRGAAWVIDPVIRSSSGAALIEDGGAAYGPLLRAGAILTPNLAEAAELAGLPPIRGAAEMERAGVVLLARGAVAVVAKGGPREGEPRDLVVTGEGVHPLRGKRRPGTRRGTGCRLAAFLASRLAVGEALTPAAEAAKRHVAAYLDGSDGRLLPAGSPPRMAPK